MEKCNFDYMAMKKAVGDVNLDDENEREREREREAQRRTVVRVVGEEGEVTFD